MYVSTCKGGANGQYTYVRLMESYRDENGVRIKNFQEAEVGDDSV